MSTDGYSISSSKPIDIWFYVEMGIGLSLLSWSLADEDLCRLSWGNIINYNTIKDQLHTHDRVPTLPTRRSPIRSISIIKLLKKNRRSHGKYEFSLIFLETSFNSSPPAYITTCPSINYIYIICLFHFWH